MRIASQRLAISLFIRLSLIWFPAAVLNAFRYQQVFSLLFRSLDFILSISLFSKFRLIFLDLLFWTTPEGFLLIIFSGVRTLAQFGMYPCWFEFMNQRVYRSTCTWARHNFYLVVSRTRLLYALCTNSVFFEPNSRAQPQRILLDHSLLGLLYWAIW